ncbi:MAG: M28 family peptidase [Imperialibacter sp.]|uniref:M28 family peptidase n=1 Tax=Imperialibacter sp. TaxID=2038411 RepID=UPI0032EBA07E
MIQKFSLLVLAVVISCAAFAQDKKAIKTSKTITKEDLYARLEVLTSDSLEGRETATEGQRKAAAFIAGQFKQYGLQPIVPEADSKSYFQRFPLQKSQWTDVYVRAGGTKLENGTDMLYFGAASTAEEVTAEVVFIGDLAQAPGVIQSGAFKNKIVAVRAEDARSWRAISMQFADAGIKGFVVFGGESDTQFKAAVDRYKNYITAPRLGLGSEGRSSGEGPFVFIVSPDAAKGFFGLSIEELMESTSGAEQPMASISFKAEKTTEEVITENVLGFLEGTDKKDEVLVVTAHYDHLGKRDDVIYHGADDDGSGTSAVLEIAQAFSEAKKKGNGPRRSILFMTVTGEEKGLLGSEYYTDHPVLPLSQTVANLNIDMIGRVDDAHLDNENYIYVIGSDKLSQDLHLLSEKANKDYTNLALDYTYNDENDPNRFYYRSDHYNFAKNNVPIIFYFNGVHADYHRPTDTIEKIAFDKMTAITKLVFFTAWEVANREERIKLD